MATSTATRTARPTTQRPGETKPGGKDNVPVGGRLDQLKQALHTDTLVTDARSTAWRLRRQSVPHVVTGSVFVGGLAEHALIAQGHPLHTVVSVSALLSAASVPAIYKWIKKVRKRWVKRATIASAIAGAWLSFIAPFGITPLSASMLLSAEFLLAAGYWRANRIPYPDSAQRSAMERARQMRESGPFGTPQAPALNLAQQTMADWKKFIASGSGPVPDSVITNPVEGKHTIAFDGNLSRGKQSFSTLLMAMPKIASGLDTRVENLIFETTFENFDGNDGDEVKASEARFKFQLVTNSPIRGNIEFTGPRREGGTLYLGPYADGSGEAPYRLYTPGSMWSGVVIGGTGSGKSRLLENVVLSAISGGDTVVLYLDPQRGVSSPVLANKAHWFCTMEDIDALLAALFAAMAAREEENAAEGWTGFYPSPERPGILTVIDESHRAFEGYGTEWAQIAREGRKLGFGLLVADQYPGLKTFGNEEPLRSSVMEGNSFVLRSTSRQTGQLMPGLMVDPLSLPKIPGYAYVNGSEENGARTAPFRNRNTRPMHMTDGEAMRWLTDWFDAQPMPDLDPLVKTAISFSKASEAYKTRSKSETDRRDRSMARVEALRNGLNPDDVAPTPTQTITLTRAKRPVVTEHGEVVSFPEAITEAVLVGDEAYSDDGTIVQKKKSLTESQRMILVAVAAGANVPSAIEEVVDLSKRQVQNLLKELVERGELYQPKYGQYARRTA